MTEGIITYATATPEQQKRIDGIMAQVGSDPKGIVYYGSAATKGLLELAIEIGQSDLNSAAKILTESAAVLNQPQSGATVEQFLKQIDIAEREVNNNGEKIEKFIALQNDIAQNLQLSLAAVFETEQRLIHGVPSAPAKYDLDGADTRSFTNNLDALKNQGEAKAQEAVEIIGVLAIVKKKGNQLAATLDRCDRSVEHLKSAGTLNTEAFINIMALEAEAAITYQTTKPAPKASKKPRWFSPV
jgi:hypothetical protein